MRDMRVLFLGMIFGVFLAGCAAPPDAVKPPAPTHAVGENLVAIATFQVGQDGRVRDHAVGEDFAVLVTTLTFMGRPADLWRELAALSDSRPVGRRGSRGGFVIPHGTQGDIITALSDHGIRLDARSVLVVARDAPFTVQSRTRDDYLVRVVPVLTADMDSDRGFGFDLSLTVHPDDGAVLLSSEFTPVGPRVRSPAKRKTVLNRVPMALGWTLALPVTVPSKDSGDQQAVLLLTVYDTPPTPTSKLLVP